MIPCFICERLALWREGENPYFVHEFKHSIFVIGDHQFFKGYSLVLLKEHVRELHELPENMQQEHFLEVMAAGKTIQAVFKPWKLNYACYGNLVPHVHWHIFPRYEAEPDHTRNPWLHSSEFAKHTVDPGEAKKLAKLVRQGLRATAGS